MVIYSWSLGIELFEAAVVKGHIIISKSIQKIKKCFRNKCNKDSSVVVVLGSFLHSYFDIILVIYYFSVLLSNCIIVIIVTGLKYTIFFSFFFYNSRVFVQRDFVLCKVNILLDCEHAHLIYLN